METPKSITIKFDNPNIYNWFKTYFNGMLDSMHGHSCATANAAFQIEQNTSYDYEIVCRACHDTGWDPIGDHGQIFCRTCRPESPQAD